MYTYISQVYIYIYIYIYILINKIQKMTIYITKLHNIILYLIMLNLKN